MDENLYMPEGHMTASIVREIMKEFEWSNTYQIIDETDLVETIVIKFSKSEIEFKEVPDDGIHINFLTYNNKELDAEMSDIIGYIENYNPSEDLDLEFNNYSSPIEDVKSSLRNNFKILQHYFMPFILGEEVSWVEEYTNRNNS